MLASLSKCIVSIPGNAARDVILNGQIELVIVLVKTEIEIVRSHGLNGLIQFITFEYLMRNVEANIVVGICVERASWSANIIYRLLFALSSIFLNRITFL